MNDAKRPERLLDPGMCLSLRPMRYPAFYEMYRNAIKNTWSVEEVDFASDIMDLKLKLTAPERHLIERLAASIELNLGVVKAAVARPDR